jgi:hypothetical protein
VSNLYPSIPEPYADIQSLLQTVRQLKEAVELLTGQRGDADETDVGLRTRRLESTLNTESTLVRAVIATNERVSTSADEALSERSTAIEAEIIDARSGQISVGARIIQVDTARATGDSALSSRTTLIESEITGARGGQADLSSRITQVDTARASGDTALSSRATTLEASSATYADQLANTAASGLQARIVNEETARASGDSANATSINDLSAIISNPSTGLAATKATADSASSAAATADGKAVAAQSAAVAAQSAANTADGKATTAQADAGTALSAATSASSSVSSLQSQTNAIFGGSAAGTSARFTSFANPGITEAGFNISAFNTLNNTTYEVGLTGYAGPSGRGVKLGGNGAVVQLAGTSVQLLDASVNSGTPVQMFSVSGGKYVFNPLAEIDTSNIRSEAVRKIYSLGSASTDVPSSGTFFATASGGHGYSIVAQATNIFPGPVPLDKFLDVVFNPATDKHILLIANMSIALTTGGAWAAGFVFLCRDTAGVFPYQAGFDNYILAPTGNITASSVNQGAFKFASGTGTSHTIMHFDRPSTAGTYRYRIFSWLVEGAVAQTTFLTFTAEVVRR